MGRHCCILFIIFYLVNMRKRDIRKLVSRVVILLFCIVFGTGFTLFGSEDVQAPRNNPSIGMGETTFLGPGLMNVPAYSGVYLHSGEFFLEEHDLVIPGRGFDFDFHRVYKSQSIFSGPLGWNWDHAYNRRLLELPTGDVLYFNGMGRRERYVAVKYGDVVSGYTSPAGALSELKKRMDGTFTLVFPDRFIEIYDPLGRLSRLQDRNANKMEFYYDFGGNLSAVQDTMGRLIVFEYNPVLIAADQTVTPESGRLKSISDFAGRKVTYEYDLHGDLVRAILGERSKTYAYSTSDYTSDLKKGHNLVSVSDPKGQKYLQLTYDYNNDKLTSEKIGESTVTISAGPSASTIDGNSFSRNYTHNDAGNPLSVKEAGFTTTFSYNADGLVTSVHKPMGNSKQFVYDSANAERRARGNVLQVTETPDSRGGSALITSYTYEANTNQAISMTDAKGNRTTYARQNAAGNLDTVVAPLNATYSYAYNQYGQVTQMTDPKGAVTSYAYYPEAAPAGNGNVSDSGRALDSTSGGYLSNVVVDTAADKISSAYVYNDTGNVVAQIDGEGVPAQMQVDQYNLVERIERGMGEATIVTSYSHDANGNVEGKLERGITENYTYNSVNLPLTMTRIGGGLAQPTSYNYDLNFNLKTIHYPKGNQDTFNYDERNLTVGKTLGGITTLGFTYDNNGNQTHFTDGENNDWQTMYDGHDRVIGKIDPLQNSISYTLDNNSNLTGISGPENLLVSNQYDELNRMDSSTVAGNITQGFVFDASGNLTQYTKPNGFAWKSTFSGAGLLKTTSDPLGNTNNYGYDKRALPLSVNETESGGRSLNHTISYNALGNVSSSDDSLQRKWQHHYDGNNQLPQNRVDPENGAVSYGYDALNRFNKETRYIAYKGNTVPAATGYEYDLNNNMTAVKDDNANETVYQYDTKDRLTRTIYPDGRSESYTYDRNDRLLSRTDANGTLVSNVYDAAGRLTSRSITPATGVEGPTHETFAYDGLNRLERAENENSITALVYDNAGRLLKETQQIKNGTLIAGTYEVNMDYDKNGNKTSLTYPSGKALSITPDALDRIANIQSGSNPVAGYTYEGQDKVKIKTLGNGLKLEAEYDDGKRPTGFKYANALTNKEIIGQTSTWNKVDLQTAMTRADASKLSKNFAYDSTYRLRNSVAAQDETAYEIDGADNIRQVTETKKGVAQTVNHEVNNRNQVIIVDGQTLTYDNNGNLVQMTGAGTTTNYTYDYKNQLVKVIGAGTQVEFVYDALGRRVQKKAVYSSSSDVTRYVYDGNQVIEERDSTNTLKTRYAYGNGIDEPVQIERAGTAGTLISYLPMQDTNGNVIGIADGTGKLVEKVQYDAYGQPTFIYDQEPPQVDQVRVVDGKVRIRFSEAVNEVTAKDAITLKEGANEVAGSIVFEEEGKLAVFTPSSALQTNIQYALEITTDLEDVSGNKLAVVFNEVFVYPGTDIMVYDRVAPQVESVKLVDGKLSVELSEEIDPASAANAIGLTYASGTINGTSSLEDAKTILFTPSSSLYNATEYTLAVKTTVMDLSGKALTAYSVKFTYTGKDLLIYQIPDPSEHLESAIGNSTLFQGREFDPETGLYYFRARYLHPKLGRFLQGDPKGYTDSMNPYQAMGNNPVNFSDPMGTLSFKKWVLGAAEGLVNFGIGLGSMISPQMLPIRTSVNFTDPKKPIIVSELDTRSNLDKLADASIVKPTADFLVDVSVNTYFGVLKSNVNQEVRDEYQQGLSRNIGQVAGIVLTAKAIKSGSNRGSVADSSVCAREMDILEGRSPGVNIIAKNDALKYRNNVAGGRPGAGTALTDMKAFEDILGKLPSNKRIVISHQQATALENALGLKTGCLNQGGIISIVENIADRAPRSPLSGNQFFLGPNKGLPGGGPEINIAPINTAGGAGIRQIIVEVK
jgi:RHS repeat-associated protein